MWREDYTLSTFINFNFLRIISVDGCIFLVVYAIDQVKGELYALNFLSFHLLYYLFYEIQKGGERLW